MITELELKNFRGFSNLTLTDLGPVNLVVGMNNVGKTTLLEAISLLGGEGYSGQFHRLYRDTSETQSDLFFSHLRREDAPAVEICSVSAKNERGEKTVVRLDPSNPPPLAPDQTPPLRNHGSLGSINQATYSDTRPFKTLAASIRHSDPHRRLTLLSQLLENGDREEELIRMLKALDDRVDAVRILNRHGQPYVALGFGRKQRIPVANAGQGMDRLVGIFSEILGEKADIVCIDEIENGLHHTAFDRIWEGVAEIAKRIGVQLFVTTHSKECLESAHHVFANRSSYDLRVIQLYRVRNELDGRVLNRELIEASVISEIEVR